jgi:predicted hydrocarbon binding protein
LPIDGLKIVQAVMESSRIRESKGIIPIFGVYVSLNFVQYYNRLSFEFEKLLGEKGRNEAATHLIAAAQECGYATFHGIRNSWEWQELVQPMIEKAEDQILGFTAVAEAFGWGAMEVKSIIPDRELRIKVRDSYEASGYRQDYGRALTGKCYMLRGVTAAFMDLLYGEDYPDGCFTFKAEEIRCRAKGEPTCEFLAQKNSQEKE